MKILVTGGAGFIGSAVCRLLIGEFGETVLNLDKLTYASNLASLKPTRFKVEVTPAMIDEEVERLRTRNGKMTEPESVNTDDNVLNLHFAESDAAGTRKSRGLGLGLSIVKHLVEMHGGSVRALSDGIGKGSTFIVHLPVVALQGEAGEADRVHPRAALSDATMSIHSIYVSPLGR